MNRSIWQLWKKTLQDLRRDKEEKAKKDNKHRDIHTRLMKQNYDEVPQWWFHITLVLTFALSIVAIEGFHKGLQLPWWGLIMACGIAFFFTLPIGIIQATTNMVQSFPNSNI